MMCQPGAVLWIEEVFGDCIYTSRDMVGFCCGLASICCWLVAQVPQLYRNYRTQSADALSPWFLAEWLLGDTFNLLGALLKGDQPPTVVLTAQYFVCVDAVMLVQYLYYVSLQHTRQRAQQAAARRRRHHHHRQRHGRAAGNGAQQQHSDDRQRQDDGRVTPDVGGPAAAAERLTQGRGEGEISVGSLAAPLGAPPRDAPFRPQRALACLATLLVLARFQGGGDEPQADGMQQGRDGRRLLHVAARAAAAGLASHAPDWTSAAGTALGYCSCALYLTSRLSQIYKNQQRGSAEGLAISMFLTAIAANSCYGASILLRSATWPQLRSSLPWLIGSLGTVCLDLTIFAQARMLGAAAKQHPSDEDEPLLPGP